MTTLKLLNESEDWKWFYVFAFLSAYLFWHISLSLVWHWHERIGFGDKIGMRGPAGLGGESQRNRKSNKIQISGN